MALMIVGVAAGFISVTGADAPLQLEASFEKQGGESSHSTPKFNVLAVLMIVAVLVVALLFLVNQRQGLLSS
ncbi:hypothetical protein HPB50_019750 [Hyalomma asiaticum]|uniref:Uncharacterized protein n=1 Tax=Hyalomma asiaticum TaxID=266040 RepID=A0ACB7RVQ6_HYAAI|nr:hypothetical protein HPB50_019750 [Hyalomma asiaticum]